MFLVGLLKDSRDFFSAFHLDQSDGFRLFVRLWYAYGFVGHPANYWVRGRLTDPIGIDETVEETWWRYFGQRTLLGFGEVFQLPGVGLDGPSAARCG